MRLRELLRHAPAHVRLEHRAFLLRPDDQDREFTPYQLQHREAARRLTGLDFRIPEAGAPYPRSSFPALEAAKWVEAHFPDRFLLFDLSIFEAFFARTEDISSSNVLSDIARGVGVPPDGLSGALAARTYRDAVLRDHREALERGVTAIPTVDLGGRALSGAAPYADYATALEAALLSDPQPK